jgi:predicted Zn finger-like uncharacterized protein
LLAVTSDGQRGRIERDPVANYEDSLAFLYVEIGPLDQANRKVDVMIIQCESCVSKYFLPESKIPPRPMKVSCPKCHAVFRLALPAQKVFAVPAETVVASGMASVRTAEQTAAELPVQGVSKSDVSKPSRWRGVRSHDDRARRLARVLVSDILCYNQDKRDQALLDGNLMTALGDDIKKSWELYKEKVGPELANSTNYFKEALNEILADGQKVF